MFCLGLQVVGEVAQVNDVPTLALLVDRWSKYVDLAPDDRDAILALPFTRKTFGKDAYILREGEQTTDCALLLRGIAFRQKLLRNGSRQIISFHVPGEFVDLQNNLLGVSDHNVQAFEGTEAAIIPGAALARLAAEREAVRLAMWTDTLVDASVLREWVVNVGRRSSRARIAHLLCELALRLRQANPSDDARLDFPVTQEQIADATGLTAVHTNRTLQTLRKDGLIQLTGRSLTVLDWKRLREAAGFDELYLHQHPAATAPALSRQIS